MLQNMIKKAEAQYDVKRSRLNTLDIGASVIPIEFVSASIHTIKFKSTDAPLNKLLPAFDPLDIRGTSVQCSHAPAAVVRGNIKNSSPMQRFSVSLDD